MSGPCLTHAAPETAPGGLFVGDKPLCGGPNVNLSGGSLRAVVSSPPLYRTCHDVRSSASWPTKSVSRWQQSVSTISFASHRTLLHGACGGSAPRTAWTGCCCGSV